LETPIVITDSLSFAQLPFDKDTLTNNIQENHPMLQMFELQQEVARKAISLNNLNSKPSFGIGLDYIIVNQRSDANPANNGRDILQLRASVKIPLNRKKYNAKQAEENLKIATLENKKADILSLFNTTIEKAYADYHTAQLKMDLYKRQIEITQAAINILESEYSVKGSNFDELLRLEKELIDYDLKTLKAIVQSHLAKSVIERFIISK
jgi:outer membrane protein TolC